MPHKAGSEFFKTKRGWSRRKDQILDYYLTPYLAKVALLGRPILIVDGFAGPGRFGDGESGSPLLICEKAKVAISRGADVKVWCIELDKEGEGLFEQLGVNIKPYSFAQAEKCSFLSKIDEIERLATNHTIFLYVDPFTVEGLEWQAIDRIISHISKSHSSIELLLNFNAASFVRRGLAALSIYIPANDDVGFEDASTPTVDKLNEVVGGDWWIQIMRRQSDFDVTVDEIVTEFCRRLHLRFNEVCQHRVKEKVGHSVPKYVLIFGSRHPDGLLLMNEAMIKSREVFAEQSRGPGALFEMLPTDVVPDPLTLPKHILAMCDHQMTRKELLLRVVRKAFCDFGQGQIQTAIAELVSKGVLRALPMGARLNDQTLISKAG